MSEMTTDAATALRRPFPSESVGKLPKSTCRDCSQSQRKRCDRHQWVSNCPECHGSHTSATLHLDYVGHAAVTDRLLTVDPHWSWEPFALGPDGLPAADRQGNLWIRLTVLGVTRIGVGDGKNAKEIIGDAIRNAAMRFGVGLDLWAKENLVEFAQHAQQAPAPVAPSAPTPPPEQPAQPATETGELMTDKTRRTLFALFGERGIDDRDEQIRGVVHIIGRPIESRSEITEAEAREVIARLRGKGGE